MRLRAVQPLLVLILILAGAKAEAAEWLKEEDYIPGPELCRKHSDSIKNERGAFVEAPINATHPELGTTPIYYWLIRPFDPSKPTLVFFTGGPAQSSHNAEFPLLDSELNVVYFDPRGVSCSKPLNFAQYRTPGFYSSENIAHDAEMIRQALGAEKITVYGHSYGTVPATIYGSLYPAHTRAVILEGTIFEGNDSLYQSDRLRKLAQDNFDSLSPKLRGLILDLSNTPGIAPEWYSRVNHFMTYLDDPFAMMNRWLESSLTSPDYPPSSAVSGFADSDPVEDEFGFSLVMHAMTGCQELGMNSPGATFYSVFDSQKRLVSDGNPKPQNRLCQELGVSETLAYSATRYPVSVPITYFQGEYDGATEVTGARKHFQAVPKGFAQFLMLQKGGHSPNISFVQEHHKNNAIEPLQRKIFAEAVLGHRIPQALINEINAARPLQWRVSTRN